MLSFDFITRGTTERRITNEQASLASPIAGKLFVLVGAGGAGRAIAFGAKSRGARVVIFNRNFGKLFSLKGPSLSLHPVFSHLLDYCKFVW